MAAVGGCQAHALRLGLPFSFIKAHPQDPSPKIKRRARPISATSSWPRQWSPAALVVDQFGFGQTWFCKWICPAGTLEAGIPLMLIKADLRPLIGFMYNWKRPPALFVGWFVVNSGPSAGQSAPSALSGGCKQMTSSHDRRRRELPFATSATRTAPSRSDLWVGQLPDASAPEMRLVLQVQRDQLRFLGKKVAPVTSKNSRSIGDQLDRGKILGRTHRSP
jgi:hypothetical protein